LDEYWQGCQHRLLPNQKRPRAVKHQDSLLIGALDRNKPHMFGPVTASPSKGTNRRCIVVPRHSHFGRQADLRRETKNTRQYREDSWLSKQDSNQSMHFICRL
jgi:hypothetical protein